jgi:Flp pilus assembly CpaF family ATPase/MinD-like ATPase involved in chromosome partitioning or flagellar assembly
MANKIVIMTGAREGVGKTTLAANFAARYSHIHSQPVILVDTDTLCRSDLSGVAGSHPGPTVLTILENIVNKRFSLSMLRGRIPINRSGIGVINLAEQTKDIEHITSEQWGFFLQTFVQLYDIVVDLEAIHPLHTVSIDLADMVCWSFLPNLISVQSTVRHLEWLHNEKFGFDKFVFIANQTGLPGCMPQDAVEQALDRFEETVDMQLPYESEIPRLLNQGKPAIVEQSRSFYFQKMSSLVDQLPRFKRNVGVSFLSMGHGASAGQVDAASFQNAVADTLMDEKRKRWNQIKQRIHRELVEELNIRRIDLDTQGDPAKERQLRTNVESTVNALISKMRDLVQTRDEREQLVKELVDEALGLGPLEELLRDPAVTEIMVNKSDQVFIERKGKISLSDKHFVDNNHIIQVIRRIISPLGRRIDESVPLVDARLKDGSRVNAIIPPLAVQGPTLTIRRFPEKAYTAQDLISMHSISTEMIEFLKTCVALKKNIVISGGTGTGKTTVLNMLSGFIPEDERIITVEDTAELRLQQEHVVRLEARPSNVEGHGQITIRDLVRNCLRMRPDRIVVGECRGGEALDMLQAMNTGHDGSLTTIHANSPRDAFTRLETMCLMAGMDLPVWALREQIRSAIHIVLQLSRLQDGSRRVTCITEVTGRNEETILTQDLFQFVQQSVDEQGHVIGHHEACGHVPTFFQDLKSRGLSLDVNVFHKGKAA